MNESTTSCCVALVDLVLVVIARVRALLSTKRLSQMLCNFTIIGRLFPEAIRPIRKASCTVDLWTNCNYFSLEYRKNIEEIDASRFHI